MSTTHRSSKTVEVTPPPPRPEPDRDRRRWAARPLRESVSRGSLVADADLAAVARPADAGHGPSASPGYGVQRGRALRARPQRATAAGDQGTVRDPRRRR